MIPFFPCQMLYIGIATWQPKNPINVKYTKKLLLITFFAVLPKPSSWVRNIAHSTAAKGTDNIWLAYVQRKTPWIVWHCYDNTYITIGRYFYKVSRRTLLAFWIWIKSMVSFKQWRNGLHHFMWRNSFKHRQFPINSLSVCKSLGLSWNTARQKLGGQDRHTNDAATSRLSGTVWNWIDHFHPDSCATRRGE